MALRLTQPLIEMGTRNIVWGEKVHRADNLTTFTCRLFGSLNFLEHSGPAQACNGFALPLQVRSREKEDKRKRG